MSYRYTVSVVVPVYNVERYVAETIDSVINQTIGFEDSIQLILINDGSSDNSEAIALDYKERYPENIVYISQENSGVSSARNRGLSVAEGKYIALLDSDDKINPKYYQEMVAFLDSNKSVPFAAARVKWFGAKDEYHISDYKFDKTRVIDLVKDSHMTHSLVGTTVFRAEAVGGVEFDTEMTHNEDAKFIDTVLLKWGTYIYGVVREAVYMYRKREGDVSASDSAKEQRSFYESTIRYAEFLSDTSLFTGGSRSPAFIQFHALYHYRWRITQTKKPDILTDDEWSRYKATVIDGIKSLDVSTIIKGSVNLNLRHKMALLYTKFDSDRDKIGKVLNQNPELKRILIDDIRFTVNTINYTAVDGIVIEGSTPFCEPSVFGASLKFFLEGSEVESEAFDSPAYIFDDKISGMAGFRVVLPADERGELSIELTEPIAKRLDIAYESTARISMRQNDYRILKGSILLLPSINSLVITDFKLRKVIMREALFFLQNLLKNKYRIERNVLKTLAVELVRLAALISIRRRPSSVWLFSDRSISGGDNSEVLFRYVSKQQANGVRPYYAINKETETYKRLKREGYNVVAFKSIKHLYLSIVCEMILPSHMDMMYLYPWFGVWQKYCGLIQYDIAHTQHGIVLNDLSNYISKRKKNASVFISACEWEKRHLTTGSYGYTPNQVPVTGLPRYDELKDTSGDKRIIALHPTWRSWLSGEAKDGRRARNVNFKDSSYYRFYQRLINDARVIDSLERNDFILKYYIHPNHIANKEDFTSASSRIKVMDFPYNYKEMFSESRLFITDYSNTLFDFAYLRKPVIHTQFDFDEFFSRHGSVSKQIFNYEEEGFGSVCYDYETSVDKVISFLDQGGGLSEVYEKRIDDFFTYSDAHNSKRAYEAIYEHFSTNRIRD